MSDWANNDYYWVYEKFLFKFLTEYVRSPTVVVLVGGDDDEKKKLADRIIHNASRFDPENYQKFDKKEDLSKITPDFVKDSWDDSAHIIDLVGGLSGDFEFLIEVYYKLQKVGSGTVVMLWVQKDGSTSGSATDEAICNMGELNIVCASNRLFIVKG